ncbi:MAG: hypothetical protein AAF490_16790, partial [Chloroflexota bacterium]
ASRRRPLSPALCNIATRRPACHVGANHIQGSGSRPHYANTILFQRRNLPQSVVSQSHGARSTKPASKVCTWAVCRA